MVLFQILVVICCCVLIYFYNTIISFLFQRINLLSNRIKIIVQINFNFNKNIMTLNDKHQIKKFNLCNKNEKNKRNQKNKNVFTSLYYPTKKN